MKVVVAEVGDMPAIATYARLNARAGAKALADIMAEIDTVDMGKIVLDWTGDGFTPVMTITAWKSYPGWAGKAIYLEPWHIDIDDAFSKDFMDNGGLRDIAQSVKLAMQLTEDTGIAKGIV
jgi:hypothetical protein